MSFEDTITHDMELTKDNCLTLDYAIERWRDKANEYRNDSVMKFNKQMYKWLVELKKYKDKELKEFSERCYHKQYKYTFHLAVSGNDEYCMSMNKKETYYISASSDIDAYNQMIDYCNSQDYNSFAVEYMEKEELEK